MKCGADKLSNANISKLLFVNIEQGGSQLANGYYKPASHRVRSGAVRARTDTRVVRELRRCFRRARLQRTRANPRDYARVRECERSLTLTHLLLADNDTVPIVVWCGGGVVHSTDCPL